MKLHVRSLRPDHSTRLRYRGKNAEHAEGMKIVDVDPGMDLAPLPTALGGESSQWYANCTALGSAGLFCGSGSTMG